MISLLFTGVSPLLQFVRKIAIARSGLPEDQPVPSTAEQGRQVA